MFFHQRFIPGLAIYSYMVGDTKTKQVAVVDPTRDVDEYLRIAKAEGLWITHILETHVHADFVSGAAELQARTGGKAVVCSSGMGGKEWTPPYAKEVIKDGDQIELGSVRLKAVYTPGHTPEHIAWAVYDDTRSRETPWLMLTGDFLFVGDVGRPDLLGDEARKQLAHQLYESVFKVLPGMPDFTEVYPAHGAGSLCGKDLGSRASSTLGYERRFNGSLQAREEAAWVQRLLDGMPIAPPYFRRMKAVNAAGPKVLGEELPGQRRLTVQDVRNSMGGRDWVLDLRPKEAFAAAHIPGSVNIPMSPQLPTWAGWVLPGDVSLTLVLDKPTDVAAAGTHLCRVGFDQLSGYLEGGMEAWEAAGLPLARTETLSVHELAKQLRDGKAQTVLDVRTEGEWNAGHIDGAQWIHAGQLGDRLGEVPRDKRVALVCGTGYRASIAASLLERAGLTDTANVIGGMTAWKAAGLPVKSEGAPGCTARS